jgi:Lysine methyltransferase
MEKTTRESTIEDDDWSNYGTLNGFSEYSIETFVLSDDISIVMNCVKALTPYDMINLCNGVYDSTGSAIWTGALFWATAIPLLNHTLFFDKRILELGAGTGFGGIALLSLLDDCQNPLGDDDIHHKHPSLPTIVMTDSEESLLQICRENCRLNFENNPTTFNKISVQHLDWNQPDPCHWNAYDVVFATDVVYDIDAIIPLLSTASACLHDKDGSVGGIFMLSHIPRASLVGSSKIASRQEMEDYIIHEANKFSFYPMDIIHVDDLKSKTNIKHSQCHEIQFENSEASIMIFEKKRKKETRAIP